MNQNVNLDSCKEQVTADIHALSHDGRGIATIDNKTTFISSTLPTEKVTYKITQKRGQYNEAEMLSIVSPSSERVMPPCEYFGLCGGCSLQHMSMTTQMMFKQQTLLDQLKHFGKVSPETILAPLSSHNIGYRRKARLGVKFVIKKDKMLVGFREKSSNYLADLEHCAVLHPKVGEHLLDLRELVASLEQYRQIPQIEVAIGDENAALVFRHMQSLSESDQEKLKTFGKNHHFHIYLQPNPPALVHKLWPEDSHERLSYTLPDYQLEFLFHPLDFTQINLELNRLMVKQAIEFLALKGNDTILDLFCGLGNFTLPIARHVKQVTGIEGSIDMVKRAKDNADHNLIENADFYAANLQEPSAQASWIKSSYDKILLDPPRAGAKEILPYFKQFSANRVVYVSCNPATLARDAGELVHQYGYRLKAVGVMNMFPHTSHIEAMAVFDK